jgi:uncharacterized protein (TIGR03084 family)
MDAAATATILADLEAESAALDLRLADLSEEAWHRDTPAAGWTVAHQVAHLTSTDAAGLLAITDPQAFATHLAVAAAAPQSFVDDAARAYLAAPPQLLARWRRGRGDLATALSGVAAEVRVPWYGTAMSAASFATARLMETWAHALDIADAVGVRPEPTARLRHIAFLGHRTLAHAFVTRGRAVPTVPVRVVLEAPDGTPWTYGPPDAAQAVTGPAWDFCLLVTQRAHRDDLALVATGPVADEWLDIAQAFAGPPGAGRPAGAARTAAPDPGAAPAGAGP